jgi:hypothetical protein
MKNLLTIILLMLSQFTFSQVWLAGSSGNSHSESFDIEKDAQGNTYIIGYFSGATVLKNTTINSTNPLSDVFVAKFSASGHVLWVKTFGGTQSDRGLKIALTPSNELLITGYFHGAMQMGAFQLQSNTNSRDFFIAKLNTSGDVIWAKSEGGPMGETAYDITSDSQGNCIVTGQFEGTTSIAGQSISSTVNPQLNTPSFDIFVAKYSPTGDPLWVKTGSAKYEDRGLSLVCDAQNNIYMTGQFSDTLNFLGQTINNQIINAGFVAKITPSGTLSWLRRIAASQAMAYDIKMNSSNELYVTGDCLGNLIYWDNLGSNMVSNPYTNKIFLLKIGSQSGSYIWGRAQGSFSEVSSRSVCLDNNQDVYIGGYFKCDFDQYKDSSNFQLWNSVGFRDGFISKFSPSGTMVWNKHIGGRREDHVYALCNGGVNRPLFTGSFENDLFLPNATVANFVNPDLVGTACSNTLRILGNNSINTKNIFVGNTITGNSNALNFYQNSNFIAPFISPNVDTLEMCVPDNISFNTNTNGSQNCLFAPEYSFQWSTGHTTLSLNISATNMNPFTLTTNYQRTDLCKSFQDTIHIIPYQKPIMPRMNDDHSFNVMSRPYNNITMCYPDTAWINYSQLCQGCSIEIRKINGPVIHNDTTDFPIFTAGEYRVTVTSPQGCVNSLPFNVIFNYQTDLDSIQPGIVLLDYVDFNDSITVCQNTSVQVMAIDLITNPNQNFTTFTNPHFWDQFMGLNFNWTVNNPNSTSNPNVGSFIPTFTGWYKIKYSVGFGYNNVCGIDTVIYSVIDSFYVEVLPLPSVPYDLFKSDNFFCQNDDFYIWTNNTYPGLSWSGPGIIWTSQDGDSIQISQSGYYTYSGTYTNPVTGCSRNVSKNLNIQLSPPPIAYTNPLNGIVCPYDSVYIYVNNTNGTYVWVGPEGNEIGYTQGLYVTEQGFYHCIFTNQQGCTFISNQVEVKEFMTPTIEISPSNDLCNGPVTLNVIYNGNASFVWSPTFSNQSSITVTQPGTYYCQISGQCGYTAIDSVQIIDNSFTAVLTANNNLACIYAPAILETNENMISYIWNGPYTNSNSNTLATEIGGTYSVTVTNQAGCTSTSPPVTIESSIASSLPNVGSYSICLGSDITLNTALNLPTTWYSDQQATQVVHQGNQFTFSSLMNDTVIYVAYNNSVCPLVIETVNIHILESLQAITIQASTTVCANEVLSFYAEQNEQSTFNWIYNQQIISTSPSVELNSYQDGDTLFLINFHLCDTVYAQYVLNIPPIVSASILNDYILLCHGNQQIVTVDFDSTFVGTIYWVYQQDTMNSPTLTANWNQYNGYVHVFGIGENGCYTTQDSILITNSLLEPTEINAYSQWCLNDDVLLNATPDAAIYYWITPTNDTIYSQNSILLSLNSTTPVTVFLHTEDEDGCVVINSTQLTANQLPIFSIADTSSCYYNELILTTPNSNWTYVWSDASTENQFIPDSTGTYWVTATDVNGCSYTDTIFVEILSCEAQAPNVVTANNDGINDYFIIPNAEIMFGNYLIIKNRWGSTVFETIDYKNTFNGSDLNAGVYYYIYYPKGLKAPTNKIEGFLHILK